MPWGFKGKDHNERGLSKKEKKHVENTQRDVNRMAKVRLQKNQKANNQEGNKGKR